MTFTGRTVTTTGSDGRGVSDSSGVRRAGNGASACRPPVFTWRQPIRFLATRKRCVTMYRSPDAIATATAVPPGSRHSWRSWRSWRSRLPDPPPPSPPREAGPLAGVSRKEVVGLSELVVRLVLVGRAWNASAPGGGPTSPPTPCGPRCTSSSTGRGRWGSWRRAWGSPWAGPAGSRTSWSGWATSCGSGTWATGASSGCASRTGRCAWPRTCTASGGGPWPKHWPS